MAGCVGEMSRVLRPPLWRHLRPQIEPYLPVSLLPSEVPECNPNQALCWLNDTSTRGFLHAARRQRIR